MVIVKAVSGIEIQGTDLVVVFPVRSNAALIVDQRVVVMATLYINVRRHMDQMSGIRDQRAQHIAGL